MEKEEMKVAITLAVFWALLMGSEANCPEIPHSEDTIMTCSNGTIAGSMCEVHCSSGLVLLPVSDDPFQAMINCRVDDTWDKDIPYCGEMCPPNAKADVVFVVDSSSLMRGVTGRLMRAFLRELISEWKISSQNVNVAIVPYSREVIHNSVLLLNIYPNDKDQLLEAVNVLSAHGGGSFTGKALTYVNNFVLTEKNGDRPDAPSIVVVMSDGRGQDSVDSQLAALWTRGVTTYAVGFHSLRRKEELLTSRLLKIAQNNPDQMHLAERRGLGNTDVIMNHMNGVYCPQPADVCTPRRDTMNNGVISCSDENRVGSICQFACNVPGYYLYPAANTINTCLPSTEWNAPQPCCTKPCPPNAKMDAVFLVESSSSFGDMNWVTTMSFLRNILRSFTVSANATNFAIFRYNRNVDTESQILLRDYPNDLDALLAAFDRIPYDGSGTYTGRALQHVADNVLTVEAGNRPGFADVVVVVTGGRASDDILAPSNQLRAMGATILVIGATPPRGSLDREQLLQIAGSDSNLFFTDGGFHGLDAAFAKGIADKVCGDPCDYQQPAKCDPNLPSIPDNGRMSCSKSNEIGSSCVFSCNQGYSLQGELTSSCVWDKSRAIWTQRSPTCRPDVCTPRRDAMNNGVISCSDENRVGSICQFSCNVPGYYLYPAANTINTCLPSTEWNAPQPCCTQPCPPNAKMDAVFLVESSSSFGDMNWVTTMRFLRNILRSFTVSANATNFAIFRYNRNVDTKSQILLRDYPNDRDALLAAFDRIPYDGSGTYTGRALQHVADNVLTVEAGNRPGFADVVVVVTGGRASDDILAPSNQLRAMGATILVIGVTPPRGSLDREQLLQIAGSDSNLFFTDGGFQGLYAAFAMGIADKVCGDPCDYQQPADVCTPRPDVMNNGVISCSDENRVGSVCQFSCNVPGYYLYPAANTINTCLPSTEWNAPQPCCTRPCPPNAKMDAVFVVDSSPSIGAANWVTMMSFVESILRSFTVSANATNFAIFRYNRDVDTKSQILLRDYPNDREALLAAFDRIPYDGSGHCIVTSEDASYLIIYSVCPTAGTFTGKALQHVADNVLTVEAGNRPGFADLVVVITDGKAADDVLAPSNQLRAMGATILVIGIPPPRGGLDRAHLLQIAGSDSNLVITGGGFQGLDASFAIQLADKFCGDPCDR